MIIALLVLILICLFPGGRSVIKAALAVVIFLILVGIAEHQ